MRGWTRAKGGGSARQARANKRERRKDVAALAGARADEGASGGKGGTQRRDRTEEGRRVSTRGGCLARRQIVKTKPESQWIVITRPLYHLQQPVSYSSRLQVIHRPGSGNCDRSRLILYNCNMAAPGR